MRPRILLAALLAPLVLAAPADAVVGGVPVDPATVPWYVEVSGCGGTLVAPDRVLTAAHCLAGRSLADVGQVSVAGNVRSPVHYALHPNWRERNGSDNFLDDVGIVQLDRPVPGVPTVTLGGPEQGEVRILGQGRPFAPGTGHSEAEMYDSTLRTAPLRSMTDRECAAALKGYETSTGERFDPRMRCSIDADGRAPLYSGCFGDSGGPLWTGTPQAPVQLGVVSWGGDRCGADHLPSVFADVARYRGFILDPSPAWAPDASPRNVKITGTTKLTCSAGGGHIDYRWRRFTSSFPPASREIGRGRTHTVARADRGHRLACFAQATSAGGYVTLGVASRTVRAAA